MAKFTKSNNPNRKRVARKKNYTERCEAAVKDMLLDQRNGYTVPLEYYEEKHNLKNNKQN